MLVFTFTSYFENMGLERITEQKGALYPEPALEEKHSGSALDFATKGKCTLSVVYSLVGKDFLLVAANEVN